MFPVRIPRFRFRLRSMFILMLGVAIGMSLNLRTWQRLFGPATEGNMASLPNYVIEPPDVLQVDITGEPSSALSSIVGQHLVGPDGTINLGLYGKVYVAGMTLDETRDAVTKVVAPHLGAGRVIVDVLAYNSKVYYVVERSRGAGDNVLRAPITGNETVLDAIAQVGGLKSPNAPRVWISRPSSSGVGAAKVLPVAFDEIAEGDVTTNYQLLPGDRLILSQSDMPATAN